MYAIKYVSELDSTSTSSTKQQSQKAIAATVGAGAAGVSAPVSAKIINKSNKTDESSKGKNTTGDVKVSEATKEGRGEGKNENQNEDVCVPD